MLATYVILFGFGCVWAAIATGLLLWLLWMWWCGFEEGNVAGPVMYYLSLFVLCGSVSAAAMYFAWSNTPTDPTRPVEHISANVEQ